MNYNFNQDYNSILTQNTGGYLGGGVGTTGGGSDAAIQNNSVNSGWLNTLLGQSSGIVNGIANIVNGTPTQPTYYVNQNGGMNTANPMAWIWIGLAVIIGLFLVMFLVMQMKG